MIPKIIHQIWVGGEMPPKLKEFTQTWKDIYPGWDYILWDDSSLGWLRNKRLFDRAAEFVPGHAVGQLKADIARYEILFRYGGMYVDCDFQALKPIDNLIHKDKFAVRQPDRRTIANGLIGVPGRDPSMEECWRELPRRAGKFKGRSAAAISGPHLFGPIAHKHSFQILPSKLFFPYSWKDVENNKLDYDDSDCYAVHHWLHRRQMFERPL